MIIRNFIKIIYFIFIALFFLSCGRKSSNNVSETYIKSSNKDITSFQLSNNIEGIIDTNLNRIYVKVPYNINLSNEIYKAIFVTTGQDVKIGQISQISNNTPNLFNRDLIYTVYAEDESKKDYIVSVLNEPVDPYLFNIEKFIIVGTSDYYINTYNFNPDLISQRNIRIYYDYTSNMPPSITSSKVLINTEFDNVEINIISNGNLSPFNPNTYYNLTNSNNFKVQIKLKEYPYTFVNYELSFVKDPTIF